MAMLVTSSWKKKQNLLQKCKEEITELIKSEESDAEVQNLIFDYQKTCTNKNQPTAVLLNEIRQMINDQKEHAELDRINFWNDSACIPRHVSDRKFGSVENGHSAGCVRFGCVRFGGK